MVTVRDLFDFAGSFMQAEFEKAVQPWDVLARIKHFLEQNLEPAIKGNVHPTAVVEANVFIDEGVAVEPHAYIQGPTWIGKGSAVRQGAYIRGKTVVGERCIVGHATEVKNAVFLDESKAGHFAYVGDSILGKGVNLGAGTKLANFKLDAGNVALNNGGQLVDTGLRKFGALLGDGVQTGCNSVTSPGCVVGRECWIYANTTVPNGVYEANQIFFSQGRRIVSRRRR